MQAVPSLAAHLPQMSTGKVASFLHKCGQVLVPHIQPHIPHMQMKRFTDSSVFLVQLDLGATGAVETGASDNGKLDNGHTHNARLMLLW